MPTPVSQFKKPLRPVFYDSLTQMPVESQFSLGQTIKNIPGSATELVKGTAQAIFNPIDTGKALLSTAAGGVQKLIPGQQAQEESFDALTNFYKQRYGSVDNMLQTIQNDPVGFAADASLLFTGGGAAATKLGTLSKLPTLSRTGGVASTIGNVIDPLRAPVNAVKASRQVVGMGGRAFGAVDGTERFLSQTQQPLKPGQNPWMAAEIPVTIVAPKGEVASKIPDITKMLLKSTFRFTDAQTAEYARRGLDKVYKTIKDFKLYGDKTKRVDLTNKWLSTFENALQSTFTTNPTKISKSQLIADLEQLKTKFVGERPIIKMEEQVDSAIEAVKRLPGEDVDTQLVNKLKRSTFDNAYNNAGDKVLDDVEHLIGDVIKKRIIDDHGDIGIKTPAGVEIPLKDFNELFYSPMVETKKIFKIAEKRSELSKVQARLLGAAIGQFLVGGAPGIIMGSISSPLVEQIPFTAIVSRAAGPVGKVTEATKSAAKEVGKYVPGGEKAALVGERVNEAQEAQQESLLDKLRKTFSFKLSPTKEDINSL